MRGCCCREIRRRNARSVRILAGLVMTVVTVFGAGAALPSAAQADALQVSTQPALYPGFDPSINDYVVRCTGGTPVQVNVSAPAGTDVSVDGQQPQTGSFSAQVGLDPGQSFSIVATGATSDAYYVRCLPSDFTGWTSSLSGQPQAEYYTVGPFARGDFQPIPPGISGNYLAIFDTNGVPMWWMKSSKQPLDFHLLSNGDVAWTHFEGFSGSEERRLDGTLVRTIQAVEPGVVADEHEILLLPNGDYALIAERPLPGFDVCGQSNVTITDYGIEEITPQGSLVWSWFASDHIPMSEIPTAWCNSILGTPAQNGAYDVYHQNAIEPDGNDFVVSFRHLDAVYKVSKADGSIVWKLGGTPRPESLTVIGDSAGPNDTFRGQHDPRVLSDGTLTVHDNGFHPGDPRTPRAVRYAIDPIALTATLVEQINDPGALQTALCCGSARKLPGGDWVMSWGTNDLVTELSPTGSRVFVLSVRQQPVLVPVLARAARHSQQDGPAGRHGGAVPARACAPDRLDAVWR